MNHEQEPAATAATAATAGTAGTAAEPYIFEPQHRWSINLEASAELRGWLEEAARTTKPDRVRFPVNPADIPDAELIATYPRPEAPRRGTEGDPENWNIPWLRGLEDWRWAQIVRCYIAINGGWPLPPPITWHPEQRSPKLSEYLRARAAYDRGEGPRPVPSSIALRRLQRDLDEDRALRGESGPR